MIPSVVIANPLDEDDDRDIVIKTTERRLIRLTMTACDVGARFAREQIDVDPAAWMLAPRRLFDGERPIDACQNLMPFIQSVLLHGLSLGLDAEPEELAAVAERDVHGMSDQRPPKGHPRRRKASKVCLYSCVVEGSEGFGRWVQAFCAIIAPNEGTVRDLLRRRFGHELAQEASVRRGFDGTEPLASILLSKAVYQMLIEVSSDTARRSGVTTDVFVEQRFTAGSLQH
jgi:hypothetical protein